MEELKKVGVGIAAAVGCVVFVIASIGFGALAGLFGVALVVILAAGILLSLVVLFCQAKLRLVSVLGVVCLIALLLCIRGAFGLGSPSGPVVGILVGALFGLALLRRHSSLYEEAAAANESVGEYKDSSGETHRYVVCGYKNLPGELSERPHTLVLGLLALLAASVLLLFWFRMDPETRTLAGPLLWSLACGLAAGMAAVGVYAAYTTERKTGLEIFEQSLPATTSAAAKDWLGGRCPQPVRWITEFWSDVWNACCLVYSVSVLRR